MEEPETSYLQALLLPGGKCQGAERLLMQVTMTPPQIPRCRARSKVRSQISMRVKKAKASGSLVSQIHPHFEEQRATVEDEELRLPFFANGDASTGDTQTFLSRRKNRNKLCSFSTLDGREH